MRLDPGGRGALGGALTVTPWFSAGRGATAMPAGEPDDLSSARGIRGIAHATTLHAPARRTGQDARHVAARIGSLVTTLVTTLVGGCAALSRPAYHGPPSDHFDGEQFHNEGPVEDRQIEDGLRLELHTLQGKRGRWTRWEALPTDTPPPGIRLEDLPPIDVVLVSHDHYDHMDVPTLRRLAERFHPRVVTGLGNAAYLARHGVAGAEALDWWQAMEVASGVRVTGVPAQHHGRPRVSARPRSPRRAPR